MAQTLSEKRKSCTNLELDVFGSEVLLTDDRVVREGSSGVYGVTESFLDVGVGAPAATAPTPAQV